jgi:hypothetical protein
MANEEKWPAMSNITTPQDIQVSVLIPLHNEQSILEQNLDILSKLKNIPINLAPKVPVRSPSR